MKFNVNFPTSEYERLVDYAKTYFGGDISEALRYCFEECELFDPSPVLLDDDDDEDDAF